MIKKIDVKINELAMGRIEEVGGILVNDHKYIQLTERTISIMREIRESLPDEKVKLLNKLDDCWGELSALSEKVIYKQGLKDGFAIKDFFSI